MQLGHTSIQKIRNRNIKIVFYQTHQNWPRDRTLTQTCCYRSLYRENVQQKYRNSVL